MPQNISQHMEILSACNVTISRLQKASPGIKKACDRAKAQNITFRSTRPGTPGTVPRSVNCQIS